MAKHILIIGSPGSGKSVFSAALASAVGKRNRQTLLILSLIHILLALVALSGECAEEALTLLLPQES